MTEGPVLAVAHALAFAVGASLGSFANVCVDRLPVGRSLLPRSSCDACGHAIRPRDLVPVASWLWLRGACRDCGAALPRHLPLVELLVGLLAVLAWRRFVPDLTAFDLPHLAAWAYFVGFLFLLTVASYTDVRHRIIPDETSIFAVIPAVLGAAGLHALGYEGWLAQPWTASVAGALLGGGLFTFAALVARGLFGVDGLGWGDVKLVAMIGAALGPMPGVMLVMLMGSAIGAIVGLGALAVVRGRSWLPFGPSLAIAAAIYVLWGRIVVDVVFPGMGQFLE